jgi:hypothetical protein
LQKNKDKNEGWRKRQIIWRHNSFLGFTAMSKRNMSSIIASETATDESKKLALEIYDKLLLLDTSLKTRKDQE